MSIFDTLTPIIAGGAAPTLGLALLVVNPKLARKLKGYVPALNKYQMMAKVLLPMVDSDLADKVDMVDGVMNSVKKVASGEATVPGVTKSVRKLAGAIVQDSSKLGALLDAVDEEFSATEFNKVNKATDGGFFRADDGNLISGLKE